MQDTRVSDLSVGTALRGQGADFLFLHSTQLLMPSFCMKSLPVVKHRGPCSLFPWHIPCCQPSCLEEMASFKSSGPPSGPVPVREDRSFRSYNRSSSTSLHRKETGQG
jgi:hypothetical protein